MANPSLDSRVTAFESIIESMMAWKNGGPEHQEDMGGHPVDSPARLIESVRETLEGAYPQVLESVRRAESAAIASTLGIGTYYEEIAIGRGAVTDGQVFWVEPNITDGLERFTMFERTSAVTQEKKYEAMSGEELDNIERRKVDSWNVLSAAQVRFEVLPDIVTPPAGVTVVQEVKAGARVLKIVAGPDSLMRVIWRAPIARFKDAKVAAMSFFVESATLGSLSGNFAYLDFRDAAGVTISRVAVPEGLTGQAITGRLYRVPAQPIPPGTATVSLDIQYNAGAYVKTVYLQYPQLSAGPTDRFLFPPRDDEMGARVDDLAAKVASIRTPDLSREVDSPNVFSKAVVNFDEPPLSVIMGDPTPVVRDGRKVLRLTTSESSGGVRYFRSVWRNPRSAIRDAVVSASFVLHAAGAGLNIPSQNRLRVACRSASNATLAYQDAAIPWSLVDSPVVVGVAGLEIPEGTASIEFDVMMAGAADGDRVAFMRAMYMGSGMSFDFLPPRDDVDPTVEPRLVSLETEVVSLRTQVGTLTVLASAIANLYAHTGNLAVRPAWLWDFPITLTQRPDGRVEIQYDARDYASTSADCVFLFVDPASGLDTNAGGAAAPLKSIKAALGRTNTTQPHCIVLANGRYHYDESWTGYTHSGKPQHLTVLAPAGAMVTAHRAPAAWVDEGGGVYSASVADAAVSATFDAKHLDNRSIPSRLILVASRAELDAGRGVEFLDNGRLYVRLVDLRVPDADVLVCRSHAQNTISTRGGVTVRLEGITFVLGSTGAVMSVIAQDGDYTANGQFINCRFAGGAGNGLGVNRLGMAIVDGCSAAYVELDGFNYHAAWGTANQAFKRLCRAIEINSHGYYCGKRSRAGNANATTAHDGMHILRLGAVGFEVHGPTLADVNSCKSFNILCYMGKTHQTLESTGASYFLDNAASTTNDGEMWLVGCSAGGSRWDIHGQAGASIFVTGWIGGPPRVGPSITINEY